MKYDEQKFKYDQILLVEGNDDKHVLWSLCEKYKINQNFDLRDWGGVETQIKAFEMEYISRIAKVPTTGELYKTVGIVIDADYEEYMRWKRIRNILNKFSSSIPVDLPNDGLILEVDNGTRVGVWIMPDNIHTGMLEHFIEFLIPKDNRLLSRVDEFLHQIENDSLNNYKLIHKQKAKMHSWLALQEDPDTPMGLAITKKYLDDNINIETRDKFIKWLNQLFNQDYNIINSNI